MTTLLTENLLQIAGLIEPGGRVLDLGCGDGDLLYYLNQTKNVRGEGIDIDEEKVMKCVERGIPVIQADIDDGLPDYKDKLFDYVVLSFTIQAVMQPDVVVTEMVRVGKRAIVSVPNFAHWRMRFGLVFLGRAPKSPAYPYEWYNTPNIHFPSIKDFRTFCRNRKIRILEEIDIIGGNHYRGPFARTAANLLADEAIFLLSK